MSIWSIPYLIVFLVGSVVCFTIPGIFFIEKSHIKFNAWEKIILGTIIGFVTFTLLSYLLLVARVHFLLLLYIVIMNLLAFKGLLPLLQSVTLPAKKHLLLLLVIFSLGIAGQLTIIGPSGTLQNNDLVFFSANGHDGAWHISLMEELKKGYPLQNPVFAGEKLVNYHFFSDVAPADFSQYFRISNLDLYFRFFPLLFSLLLGSIVYLFSKKITGSFNVGIWATVFTYFSGSFGYIVTWIQNHEIGGESLFWATQIQSSSGNPPQIAAFVLILCFLYLFFVFVQNQKNFTILLICSLLAGSLIVFKVYGGVILLGSLGLVGFWQFIRERKLQILILFAFSTFLSTILYFPNTTKSVGFLIFEPWWFIRTMVVATNRLNWLDLELQRQTYLSEHNLKRVLQVEIIAFLIFFFGNLGIKFLGLKYFATTIKSSFTNYLSLLLLIISLSSFVFPLLFLQKGVASNSIQFMQYFILLFGIFAAITVDQIISKIKMRPLKISFTIIILVLMVPTQIGLIYSFYNHQPLAKIENQEIIALQFLKINSSPNSIIVTPPYNKYLNLKIPTPPIWAWFDTAYVSALSSRRTYVSDFEQVDIMGYNLQSRLNIQENIFKEKDPIAFENLLKQNSIDYLYFPTLVKPLVDLSKTSLTQIFENDKIEIWKIN